MHFCLANIVISVIIEFYLFQNPYILFYCEQWKAENIIFIDEGVSNSYYWWLRQLQRYNRTWWAFPLLQVSQPCLRWSIYRDFFQRCFSLRVCLFFVCSSSVSFYFIHTAHPATRIDICFPLTVVTSICPLYTMLPATRKKEALFFFILYGMKTVHVFYNVIIFCDL